MPWQRWDRSLPTSEKRIRVALGLAALLLFGLTVFVIVLTVHLRTRTSDWVETTGTVISVSESRSDSGTGYSTRIMFQDTDGFEHTFGSTYGSSGTRVGDSVELKYWPRDPQRAETSTDANENTRFLLLLGGVFVALAVPLGRRALGWKNFERNGGRRRRKKKKKKEEDITAVRADRPGTIADNLPRLITGLEEAGWAKSARSKGNFYHDSIEDLRFRVLQRVVRLEERTLVEGSAGGWLTKPTPNRWNWRLMESWSIARETDLAIAEATRLAAKVDSD